MRMRLAALLGCVLYVTDEYPYNFTRKLLRPWEMFHHSLYVTTTTLHTQDKTEELAAPWLMI